MYLVDSIPDPMTLNVSLGLLSGKEVADMGGGEGPRPPPRMPSQELLRVEEELPASSHGTST